MPKEAEQLETFAGSRDRRQSVRYPIAGAVSFQWKGPDGQWHGASGVTSNIGKEGAFIACDSPPPAASPVKLVVTLPTHSRSHGPVCLCGTGGVRHIQLDSLYATGYGACVEFQLDLPMSAGLPR